MTSALGIRPRASLLRAVPIQLSPQRIAAEIHHGRRARRARFEFSVPAAATGDFALPATLLQAMSLGVPLHVDGVVDPRLLVGQDAVQRRVAGSESALRRVSVTAAERPRAAEPSGGVALFFSGGVDSFYTLLRRRDEITHLIVIRGFDLALDDPATWSRIVDMARSVGSELGLDVVEVSTDAKEIASPLVTWHWYHPCVLAAIAHALEGVAGRALVSAGYTDRALDPVWALGAPRCEPTSTSPLWSSQRVQMEVYGADVTRLHKVELIAESELAMRWLRVCWQRPGEWNCGRCEKCVRTMLNLAACGALERCRTLPDRLDQSAVRSVVLRDVHARMFARENLDALRSAGLDELAEPLDVALRRSRYRAAKQRIAALPVHVADRARRMPRPWRHRVASLRSEPIELSPTRIAAKIDDGKRTRRLHFEFSQPAAATGDFALPAALLCAMSLRAPLQLGAPVDPRLLVGQEEVQRRVATSEPALCRVPVTAVEQRPSRPRSAGVALFFSGGVDSFYTLLRRRDEITHLIVIRGFDLALDDPATWSRIVDMARSVGSELGLDVVEVSTDAKEIASPLVTWHWYHPCVLAAIAHALEGVAGRVLISAGQADRALTRSLDHTFDPLWSSPAWSTAGVELEVDGADVLRLDKVERIAGSEVAMRWLRVCWQRPGEWNCGRCEKCMRTMLNLAACGALERCRTLPDRLDPAAVRGLVLRDVYARLYARENIDRLRSEGGDELAEALELALRRSRYRAAKQRIAQLPVHVVHRVRRMVRG